MSDLDKFIENLRNELETQDNRATAYPLYRVQQERRVYGVERDFTDTSIYQLAEDPAYFWDTEEEAWDFLEKDGRGGKMQSIMLDKGIVENRDDTDNETFDEHIEEIGYVPYWETVTVHLTEKAAQRYIDENKHNLTNPQIYVSSQYRCHEFIQLIEYIKSTEKK